MVDLKAKPYNLNEEQIRWVDETRDSMSEDEKVEQLFCPLFFSNDPGYLINEIKNHSYGSVFFRPGDVAEIQPAINLLQQNSKVPLLISANLEDGGNGLAEQGTYMGRQMLIAATDDEEKAYQMGKICGREGAAVGLNWTYSPVVDIDTEFRNPITNVRTFGSDRDRVLKMGREYVRGVMEEGVLPTIKHFPGDGQDERDQHLLTSVNPQSIEEWEESYGEIYRNMIDDGVPTLMIGHIAMPAMEEYFDGKKCEKVIPASCSPNIVNGYLRGVLGFNGLVSTDATPMVGFSSTIKREIAVPLSIESGCDVFLFGKDVEEDIVFMKEGLKKGILSRERLDDAVTRILATKAMLKLNTKKEDGSIITEKKQLEILQSPEHKKWAAECADMGVTLVKDTAELLPLDAKRHNKVLLQILGDFESNERVVNHFEQLLEKEGFSITRYVPETIENIFKDAKVEDFKEKYDLVFYIGNIENASNKTVSRINWHTLFGAGNNIPWMAAEVPTVFVSVGNPYHLIDVPMVGTYINGYCHSPNVIEAVMEKLMGRSSFKGKSPVDPFCGKWDTRL